MREGVKRNGRGPNTQFRGRLELGKSEKLKERGFLSLGFLTMFGVRLSGLSQSWTRPNGLLRFPIQKAGVDHPHIHTQPSASSRQDHRELGKCHALSTPGHFQLKQ